MDVLCPARSKARPGLPPITGDEVEKSEQMCDTKQVGTLREGSEAKGLWRRKGKNLKGEGLTNLVWR